MITNRHNCSEHCSSLQQNVVCIDYRNDFSIRCSLLDLAGNPTNVPDGDFRIDITTRGDAVYSAARSGDSLSNCKFDGEDLIIIFDNHNLMPGRLNAVFSQDIENKDYPDGFQSVHKSFLLPVRLIAPTADLNLVSGAEAQMILPYIKGENGKPFTYDDLTDAQKQDLASFALPKFEYDQVTKTLNIITQT